MEGAAQIPAPHPHPATPRPGLLDIASRNSSPLLLSTRHPSSKMALERGPGANPHECAKHQHVRSSFETELRLTGTR